MVQNFEFRDGYWVYKLRTPVGRSEMTNWLHISPVLKESMTKSTIQNGNLFISSFLHFRSRDAQAGILDFINLGVDPETGHTLALIILG